MKVTNEDILLSSQSLQKLMQCELSGRYSLHLEKRLAPAFDQEVEKLQKHQQELFEEHDEETAKEKWVDCLQGSVELPGEKIPEQEIWDVNISAEDLRALSWLIDFEYPDLDDGKDGENNPDDGEEETGE